MYSECQDLLWLGTKDEGWYVDTIGTNGRSRRWDRFALIYLMVFFFMLNSYCVFMCANWSPPKMPLNMMNLTAGEEIMMLLPLESLSTFYVGTKRKAIIRCYLLSFACLPLGEIEETCAIIDQMQLIRGICINFSQNLTSVDMTIIFIAMRHCCMDGQSWLYALKSQNDLPRRFLEAARK